MSGPFVYIGRYRVLEDRLGDFRKYCDEIIELVKTKEPRVIGFNMFFDEASRRLRIVQFHPDSDSMENHMNVVAEHLTTAWDWLEDEGAEFYGPAPESLLENFAQWRPPGVTEIYVPTHIGGVTRSAAQ